MTAISWFLSEKIEKKIVKEKVKFALEISKGSKFQNLKEVQNIFHPTKVVFSHLLINPRTFICFVLRFLEF